jgi:heme exporter protein A
VTENLRFWASLYDVQVPADLLTRLDLDEYANRPVRNLSRGLVQRVAIARALVHDPRVLQLDEPFTGLDRTAAEAFSKLLAQQTAQGRATVLVTHNVEEGTELATDVAFMRAGRFVGFAPRAGRAASEIADAYRSAIGGSSRG